jgi:hypothetical protein
LTELSGPAQPLGFSFYPSSYSSKAIMFIAYNALFAIHPLPRVLMAE